MLELYNTMSRSKEVFKPLEDHLVKMFTCGPSIYARPHVGNYRSFLWEDVLQRYLEYLGHRVERVINLTDVEDKAISEAEKVGLNIEELTGRMSEQFFKEAALLRIKLPKHIPRSSTSIPQSVRLIEHLLEKGYAYWHNGNVFFDPLKFKGFGKLFRLDMGKWPQEKRRFARDTYPGRRWNLGDFILWHGYRPGDKITWDTEIGRGRPAWNIQDPAMITEHLGYAIDISCGGIDNLYRHHDYNIAVIEAVSGKEFAHYWVHGEHLLVGGKKMSKSVGNIVYPDDLLKEGYSGEQIRFYLLYGHHRRRLNLTDEHIARAVERLDTLRGMLEELTSAELPESADDGSAKAGQELLDRLERDFERRMNDDLDIQGAFDAIDDVVTRMVDLKRRGSLSRPDRERFESKLHRIDEVFQVLFPVAGTRHGADAEAGGLLHP